jgi:hypothetical protein
VKDNSQVGCNPAAADEAAGNSGRANLVSC